MPASPMNLISRSFEYVRADDLKVLPNKLSGIYVLYKEGPGTAKDVVYVGMVRGNSTGIRARLQKHVLSEKKKGLWTHCSVYEVHSHIDESLVAELEGLFRHLYRDDRAANPLNGQRGYGPLRSLARQSAAGGAGAA